MLIYVCILSDHCNKVLSTPVNPYLLLSVAYFNTTHSTYLNTGWNQMLTEGFPETHFDWVVNDMKFRL